MRNAINILIIDEDAYFTQGIKYILREYFFCHGIMVNFISPQCDYLRLDLVFISLPLTRKICCCESAHHGTRFFTIRDKEPHYHRVISPCVFEGGVLYRRSEISAIYGLLERASDHVQKEAPVRCMTCSEDRLTRREREVLLHLRRGVSQTKTAEKMHLSVKTVNAHKQSAMRKMGFRKNHDLNSWLLKA